MFDGSDAPNSKQMELSLTLSAEAFPVRTSAEPVLDLDLTGIVLDFGRNLLASFAKYDPSLRSWRTSQRCLMETWETFSETFPKSGSMRNGTLYRRAPWAHHTCDSECSLWPTPTASMDGRGFGIPLHHNRRGRYKQSTVSRVRELVGSHGWRIHPNFTEALMGFPLDHTAIAS